jgi:adenylate cyclase
MTAGNTCLSPHQLEERPLMVMDMVECRHGAEGVNNSLMERWRRWADDAYWLILSHHRGHIIKHWKMGLWMEFADARQCLQAAFALNRLANKINLQGDISQQLRLRTAAHLARYIRGEPEPIEEDRILTSHLSSLAGPSEVLITAELRDRLTNGVDADLEDLGLWAQPRTERLRLFRAFPCDERRQEHSAAFRHDTRPCLAVVPFKADAPETAHWVIGDLIAEGVIARLSNNTSVRVIAKQSTSVLRDAEGLGVLEQQLGATLVMSGRYRIEDRQLIVLGELAVVSSHGLMWRGELKYPVDDIFQEDSELLHDLARRPAHALSKVHLGMALTQPLPDLKSSALMLASIAMVHSHSGDAFQRGRDALVELIARHPRHALPKVWLGFWHAMNVVKNRSTDVARDVQRAIEQTRRALETEPNNSMALAVEGYVQCQLLGDPELARSNLTLAIEANPSEPMGWLFMSLHSAGWGSGGWAVKEAQFGYSLSPVDPLQYFFDLLMANALLANDQREQAIAYSRQSLRAHKGHVPTLRLLLTAQTELGLMKEGKETMERMRAEAPSLTVSSYLAMGSTDSRMRQRIAYAMRQVGLPE